ncbi:MAG: efflux RND transporter periplasmic adaptor subunit [Deltaproteobacteria bacterium]
MRGASRLFRSGFVFLCCLTIFPAVLAGCSGGEKAAPGANAIPVTVLAVTPRDVPIEIEFVGTTESSHQVEIRSRVEGFLEKKTYEEGGRVRAGQTMFQIDRRPFEAALQQARGVLEQQRAQLVTAEATLKRVRPLVEKKAASPKDLDDAVGQERTARAAVFSAEGSVQDAELKLSYTTIKSPIDGFAGRSKKQEGSYMAIGQDSLLTYVAKIDPVWVNFSISENENLRLQDHVAKGTFQMPKGSNFDVEVNLADGSVFPHKGRLNYADPSFSSETGTYQVRAEIQNPIRSALVIRPGQFVRVHLQGGVRPNAILVPRTAVTQGAKGHFVWVADKTNRAELRVVQVGDWHDKDIFIDSGLTAGDRVILDNLIKIYSDAPLQITETRVPDAGNGPSGRPKKP